MQEFDRFTIFILCGSVIGWNKCKHVSRPLFACSEAGERGQMEYFAQCKRAFGLKYESSRKP